MKGMILPTNKTLKYQTVSTKLDDSKPQNKIIITENGRGQIADINTQLQNMSQRLNIYSSKCERLSFIHVFKSIDLMIFTLNVVEDVYDTIRPTF